MPDKLTKEEIKELGYITCPVCDGIGIDMGGLGNLFWYHCQDCGTEFNIKMKVKNGEE